MPMTSLREWLDEVKGYLDRAKEDEEMDKFEEIDRRLKCEQIERDMEAAQRKGWKLEKELRRMKALRDAIANLRSRRYAVMGRILDCHNRGNKDAEVEAVQELEEINRKLGQCAYDLKWSLRIGLVELTRDLDLIEKVEQADRIIAMIEGGKEDGKRSG